MSKKGRKSHRRSRGLLGMGKKLPVAATTGALVSALDLKTAFDQSGVRGVAYHMTGYD